MFMSLTGCKGCSWLGVIFDYVIKLPEFWSLFADLKTLLDAWLSCIFLMVSTPSRDSIASNVTVASLLAILFRTWVFIVVSYGSLFYRLRLRLCRWAIRFYWFGDRSPFEKLADGWFLSLSRATKGLPEALNLGYKPRLLYNWDSRGSDFDIRDSVLT